MTSKVEIFNLMLSRIGTKTAVADPAENSTEARECSIVFDPSRKMALRAYPWNFAEKRKALADLNNPLAGWAYAYSLPSDCLKALYIFNEADTKSVGDPIPFKLALLEDSDGNAIKVLLTDQSEAVLIYTANIEDPNLFDPEFIYALSWLGGAEIALPLTGDANKQRMCMQMYAASLPSARASNATEGTPTQPREAEWIEARS